MRVACCYALTSATAGATAESGKRALNAYLRSSNIEVSQALKKASIELHAPTCLGDFHFTRPELAAAVRDNFDVTVRWLRQAPRGYENLVQHALKLRCVLCLCSSQLPA